MIDWLVGPQVKVNGYRIELGEIEAALCSAGADWLDQAVVLVRKNQIVAYLKAKGMHGPVTPEDVLKLKERVSRTLTSYMLPKYVYSTIF